MRYKPKLNVVISSLPRGRLLITTFNLCGHPVPLFFQVKKINLHKYANLCKDRKAQEGLVLL